MMTPTHTAILRVTDRMTGEQKERTILVRVTSARIEDEQGRYYDKALSGSQTGPHRMMPASYIRRIVLDSLQPWSRPRVRL